MTFTQPKWLWLVLGVLGLGLLAGLTVANYNFARQNPGGNDFLVHWVGTRALLLDGQTPYSDDVSLQIQQRAYGRPARPGEHELRPAYPLYSALLFAPFALVADYPLARAMWLTFLEVGVLLVLGASLRLARWRPSPMVLGILLLFSLLWYHGVRSMINGNAVIWVAVLLAAGLWAARAHRDAGAGVCFALATIKPHLVVLPIVLILLWAIAQKRWALIGWLVGSGLALTLLMMLWVPAWPLQNLSEIVRYSSYNPPTTPGATFAQWWPTFGRALGWALSAGVGLILMWTGWQVWRAPAWEALLWAICFTLALSQWSGITTDPGNYILLFLPLLVVLARIQARWGRAADVWIGLTLMVLLIGLWAIFLATLEQGAQPQQSAIMFFPLPAVVLAGLWWMRDRPTKTADARR